MAPTTALAMALPMAPVMAPAVRLDELERLRPLPELSPAEDETHAELEEGEAADKQAVADFYWVIVLHPLGQRVIVGARSMVGGRA